MTYQNNDRRHPGPDQKNNIMYWVIGSLAVLAAIFGIAYATNNSDTASNTRPAATANAPTQNPSAARDTTGSSAISKTPPATNR